MFTLHVEIKLSIALNIKQKHSMKMFFHRNLAENVDNELTFKLTGYTLIWQ